MSQGTLTTALSIMALWIEHLALLDKGGKLGGPAYMLRTLKVSPLGS